MAGLPSEGAVYSHVKPARTPAEINSIRISAAEADPCSAMISSSPARRRCWPRSARTRPASSSTRRRSIPATSPATPTFAADRAHQEGDPPERRRRLALHRRVRHHGAAWQFDCRQHVHARLRLADGLRALSEASLMRHRTQRRSRGDEPGGFHLGRCIADDFDAVEKIVAPMRKPQGVRAYLAIA